jgi:transcription elongation factor Elf1
MTSYNKPCPICRKKRIKNGKCLFCGHIINAEAAPSVIKCKYCGAPVTGKRPEGISAVKIYIYEIQLLKWVDHDICEDCMADIARNNHA